MNTGTLGVLVTILVFGAIGWLIASRRSRPAGPLPFLVLLGVAVVGYFVGVSTIVFGVGGFKIFLNWIIVAGCIGGALGLFVRNRQLQRGSRV